MDLARCRDEVRNSALLAEVLERADKVPRIRCLALGLPVESKQARYQLALMVEVARARGSEGLVWDPVFGDADRRMIEGVGFTVEEEYETGEDVLWFLPHAGLDLTEWVLKKYRPTKLLANDLESHTSRLTKLALLNKYPLLAHLQKCLAQEPTDDGFTPVRRGRKAFKEPVLEYNLDTYFTGLHSTRLPVDVGDTAFSDLAFQEIVVKSEI